MAGQSLVEIAELLGYSSGNECAQAIRERFRLEAALISEDDRDGILMMELARLDKLQFAIWQSALYGEPKAVDLALKIIGMRTKLTGVDQPDAQRGAHTVLVIGGNEENYVQKLKEMTED